MIAAAVNHATGTGYPAAVESLRAALIKESCHDSTIKMLVRAPVGQSVTGNQRPEKLHSLCLGQ
jgi:hypothetical protein